MSKVPADQQQMPNRKHRHAMVEIAFALRELTAAKRRFGSFSTDSGFWSRVRVTLDC
jgi:hypothetical protein